jgi:CHAT domain-containing protein/tetratricopeptide (TPR) repeat protein
MSQLVAFNYLLCLSRPGRDVVRHLFFRAMFGLGMAGTVLLNTPCVVARNLWPGQQNSSGTRVARERGRAAKLSLGRPLRGELKGGERDSFGIDLRAGQFMHVVTEQDVDVVVSLFGPDGQRLRVVRTATDLQSEAAIYWLAEVGGEYRLEILVTPDESRGRYVAKIAELRAPRPLDRKRIAAEEAYAASAKMMEGRAPQDLDDAFVKYGEARSLFHAVGDVGRESQALRRQALVRNMQDRPREALLLAQEAVRLLENGSGRRHVQTVPALWNLASIMVRLNRLQEARALDERALRIVERTSGTDSLPVARGLTALSDTLTAMGDDQAALSAIQRAKQIYERHYGQDSIRAASAAMSMAEITQRRFQYEQAQALYESALRAFEKRRGVDSPELVHVLEPLANVLMLRGSDAEALAARERVLRIVEKEQGADSPDAADAIVEMGDLLLRMRKPAGAREAYERALKLSDPESPTSADATASMAHVLMAEGDYAGARARFDQVISLTEKQSGAKSLEVVSVLMNKLRAYPDVKDYADGRKVYEKALNIIEEIEGAESDAYADALVEAADFDFSHNKTQEARTKFERALNILERPENRDELRIAYVLQRSGENLTGGVRNGEAEKLLRLALGTYEKRYGPNHPALVSPLNSLARALAAQDRLDDAKALIRRSLKILEDNHLGEQFLTADTLGRLAGLLSAEGNFEAAQAAAERALRIYERYRLYGISSQELEVRNALGTALFLRGDLSGAREVLEKTLALAERGPERRDPNLLLTRINIATILMVQDDDEMAARYIADIEVDPQALVESGDIIAIQYLNMAAILSAQLGNLNQAHDLIKKVFDLVEAKTGPTSAVMAHLLAAQAMSLASAKDYAGAQELADRADKLFKPLLSDYYVRAMPLMVKGEVLSWQGKLPEARAALEEATRVYETQLGAQHFTTVNGVDQLGWVNYLLGDTPRARASFLKAAGATDHHLRSVLPMLSLAEQRNFIQTEMPEQVSWLLTSCREGESLRSAYELMFRWKGSLVNSLHRQTVLEGVSHGGQGDKEVRRLQKVRAEYGSEVERLKEVRAELASWYYKVKLVPTEEWRRKNDQLTAEKERLERALARAFKPGELDDPLDVGLRGFQRLLRQDEVFLDFYLYDYRQKDNSLEERYAVVVTGPTGDPSLIELGSAKKINEAVKGWRDEVLVRADADREWLALAALLWKPLANVLPPGAHKVWVSPDSELARIPWQLLPPTSPKNKNVLLAQVDSPRELSRLRQTRLTPAARGTVTILVAGNIDYDAGRSAGSPRTAGKGFESLDTAAEVAAIRDLGQRLPAATNVLTKAAAGKAQVVAGLQRATYAHLATHGFFAREVRATTVMADQERWAVPFEGAAPLNARNPLVESGIALAGANVRDPLTFDTKGILSAEEIVGLDLSGCELVTLSACETGRGEEVTGQGVMGLRASVMAAGSRSMLMSLWNVPNEATVKLMEAFYSNLWTKKMNKAEALRQAQAAVRAHPSGKYRAPVHWAAWVLAGESW